MTAESEKQPLNHDYSRRIDKHLECIRKLENDIEFHRRMREEIIRWSTPIKERLMEVYKDVD